MAQFDEISGGGIELVIESFGRCRILCMKHKGGKYVKRYQTPSGRAEKACPNPKRKKGS
jgi:hypothetical protein